MKPTKIWGALASLTSMAWTVVCLRMSYKSLWFLLGPFNGLFPFCFIACIIGIMKTLKLASSMRFLFLFEWQRLRIETSLFNLYYAYPQPPIDIPNMSTKTVFRDIFQLNLCTFSHARTKHTKDHATILPFTTVVQYSFLGIAR